MHIPLKSLKFLALDCQTTGNSPKSSHLLEIGWLECNAMESQAIDVSNPTTFVLRQPQNTPLSKRIQKLTGIGDVQMADAVELQTALDTLLKSAAGVARLNRAPQCPVVIHYARFEMGFLVPLYQQHRTATPTPFNVICTHQIVSKLMPELPRKGIRAVAGYLGHSVPVSKRCAHHLLATAHIWRQLVRRLADQAGVHTLDQLRCWLKRPNAVPAARSYPMPREKRLRIPESPGVYRMLRSNGDVLYIGKASSLKKRINSYFHKRRHSETTLEMLTQAVGLEVTQTGTALEAALCESDAIKVFDPPYNSALVCRHRKLLFVSRDFGVHSSEMSKACPLGPVPSADPFVACHTLWSYMWDRNKTSLDISRMMAMPEVYAPDEATFASGLALFNEKHAAKLDRMNLEQAVLSIGRQSWLEKLERNAKDKTIDAELTPPEEQIDFEWTPESVTSSIESTCRRCGFMLRRARWFALLSESTVAWRTGEEDQARLNIFVLRNGDVEAQYLSELGSPIPKPPGTAQRHAGRRGRIDLMRYDRLRVLTTEIRRLLSENRLECVRLSENAYLRPAHLRMMLDWV